MAVHEKKPTSIDWEEGDGSPYEIPQLQGTARHIV